MKIPPCKVFGNSALRRNILYRAMYIQLLQNVGDDGAFTMLNKYKLETF